MACATYGAADAGTVSCLCTDCSVMPVMIFTDDHKATTIERIIAEVKQCRLQHPRDDLKFQLATGNVGVMAATNEEVEKAQFPILIYLFTAIILLCLRTFRSIAITLCIILPLGGGDLDLLAA